MRWYVILLAIFAAVMIACRADDESEVRKTLQEFFQAMNDGDTTAAYSFISDGCKANQSLSAFTDGVESAEHFGKGEVEISNIRIIELAGDRALVDADVTITSTGEEFSMAEEQQPAKLVKEDGQWRIVDCESEHTEPASFAPPAPAYPIRATGVISLSTT